LQKQSPYVEKSVIVGEVVMLSPQITMDERQMKQVFSQLAAS